MGILWSILSNILCCFYANGEDYLGMTYKQDNLKVILENRGHHSIFENRNSIKGCGFLISIFFFTIYSLNKPERFFQFCSLIFEMSAFTNFSPRIFSYNSIYLQIQFQYILLSYQEFVVP
jgi:hypothetical protein